MEKNIYHVWFQGCEQLTDPKFKVNMVNWRELNKDWNYQCLDGNDLRRNCEMYSVQCLEAFDVSRKMHTKIDLGRLVTIYLNGGMYIDMDMFVLRPLSYNQDVSALVKSLGHVLGVSKIPIESYEKLFLFQDLQPVVNNAMVISSKGNPLLKYIIDKIIESILKSTNSSELMYVHNTTGPMNFNTFLRQGKEKFPEVNVKYFESSVFEPCDITGKCKISEDTLSIHAFELSWLPKNVGNVCKLYVGNRYTILLILVLLLIFFFSRRTLSFSR